MALIDFILNLAGLLLWLNWGSVRFDPLAKRVPATLIGTLRRADSERLHRWHLLVILAGLLLLRAGIYWQIGSATKPVWAGTLNLGVVVPAFASNSFARMMLFSGLSFGVMLGIFYLCLLLLSILARPEPTPFHRLVQMPLGGIDRWPRWLKLILPLIATAVFWWLISWLLASLQVIPEPVSPAHRIEESLIIALGSYLVWKYLIGALLFLHLLNSFIYFGKHPFWNYVNATAQTLRKPLHAVLLGLWRTLSAFLSRIFSQRMEPGNVSPAIYTVLTFLLDVVEMALVFLCAELAGRGLVLLYARLPF